MKVSSLIILQTRYFSADKQKAQPAWAFNIRCASRRWTQTLSHSNNYGQSLLFSQNYLTEFSIWVLMLIGLASNPVLCSEVRPAVWPLLHALPPSFILQEELSHSTSCSLQRGVEKETAHNLTFECCDWYVGNQCVQLVWGILILIAFSGQTHTDAVRNVPKMKMTLIFSKWSTLFST